ncbi:uncharacterized protein P884DRAFT_206109 [Thermothelomyces heterothallicus CBS 202.75]|uniref:uncharacterized protein n=1 Tax=Thermothelomyces heterothallicus CBS 202.75 TaxID=1149848 RepID=UPI0037447E03
MTTIHAKLLYVKDLPIYRREKPYQILSHLPNLGDIAPSNLEFEAVEEAIQDIRLADRPFTLDDNGFCHATAPTSFSDWDSRSKVEECYLPEVKSLLKRLVDGADEVEIFDWRERRRQMGTPATPSLDTSQTPRPPNMNDPADPLQPAKQAHVDQSPTGAIKRVKTMKGDRASSLLEGRLRIINLWRPTETVENWPLALCDGASMTRDDLLETDLVRRDYVGSTMFAKYRPGYSWYYLSNQRPEEVCLIKNFDSDETVKAQCEYRLIVAE